MGRPTFDLSSLADDPESGIASSIWILISAKNLVVPHKIWSAWVHLSRFSLNPVQKNFGFAYNLLEKLTLNDSTVDMYL